MLRLAIYFESRLGRNDGNPLYVFHDLKRREAGGELSIDHLAPYGDLSEYGKYDAHLVVDWGEDGLTGILPYKVTQVPGRPLIYWASDTHLGYEYRLNYAKQADLVFVAQKRAVEEFKRDGVTAPIFWLPHAWEPQAYCDEDVINKSGIVQPYSFIEKKYDVCFIGHVNSENRVDALDRLFREFPNFYYGQKLFHGASQKYAESKVSINPSMKDDLNMRVFEVLGSKSFLLTNHLSDINILFEEGKHLVTYQSLDEMVDKVRYYILHNEERNKIAEEGYKHVLQNHTIHHRVNKILEELNILVSGTANLATT